MSQENNFIPNQENYKPLTPFQLFVKSNFPFIENTFEALDNYGLYCKIVEYLNTVIANENTVESNTTALYNAFVSLNNYVSDYFDDLDVQEEINNKLDEMVSDGQFQELYNNLYSGILNSIENLNQKINSIQIGISSPIPVSNVSGMVDTTKIYLNTSNGYWYYHDGSSWVQGDKYQSNSINRNSIKNGNLDINSVTNEKCDNILNLMTLADEIKENTKITGYNTSTYVPLYESDQNFTTAIFDLSTLVSISKMFGLKLSSNNQAYVVYTENVRAVNVQTNALKTTNYYFDNEKNIAYIPLGATNEKIAITFDKYKEIFFVPNFKSDYIKSIENQLKININNTDYNIKNTNLLKYADEIYPNTAINGYDLSTKKPLLIQEPISFVAIFTFANIPSSLLSTMHYYLNKNTHLQNVIICYNENRNAVNLTKSGISASPLYDAISNYFTFSANYYNNYEKVAIAFDVKSEKLNFYSDSWSEGNENYITVNENGNEEEIILPSKLYGISNFPYLFYYQNALRYGNASKIEKVNTTNALINMENACVLQKDSESECYYNIYKNDLKTITKRKMFTFVPTPTNVGNNQTKKVLIIGDSFTDQNIYVQKLYQLFNTDVMNIELLGTRGTAPYKEEGRSGWRAYTYCNCQYGSDESTASGFYQGLNPFYNTETESFDFSMYMQNQNYNSVDIVLINLGTNDLVRGNHNTESDIVGYYNEIINSIKEYNSNIKIGLWLPSVKGSLNEQHSFENDDSDVFVMQKYLINNFDNRENENILVYPCSLNVNTKTEFNTIERVYQGESFITVNDYVHPTANGYEKIAYNVYFIIKALANL